MLERLYSFMPLVHSNRTINSDIANLFLLDEFFNTIHYALMMCEYYELAVVLYQCVHELSNACNLTFTSQSISLHEVLLIALKLFLK
jgi:hypothetical protein